MIEVYKGSTSRSTFFSLVDSTTGLPKTGVTFSDVTGSYARTRAARVAITVITQTVTGSFSSGGFCEVDATNEPGLYRFDVPDAAFAGGAEEVVVSIKATGCKAEHKGFVLVDWNKQVASIPNAAAGASGGLAIVGSNMGSVASVTGNIGGSVATVGPAGITATSFATDAIGAASLSAAAVAKIQAGLSTYSGGDTPGMGTLLARIPGIVQP